MNDSKKFQARQHIKIRFNGTVGPGHAIGGDPIRSNLATHLKAHVTCELNLALGAAAGRNPSESLCHEDSTDMNSIVKLFNMF